MGTELTSDLLKMYVFENDMLNILLEFVLSDTGGTIVPMPVIFVIETSKQVRNGEDGRNRYRTIPNNSIS